MIERNFALNVYCLDASCLTSLGRLKDLLQVLHATREMMGDIIIYVPKVVDDAINLQPDEIFRVLPSLLSEWIDSHGRSKYYSIR